MRKKCSSVLLAAVVAVSTAGSAVAANIIWIHQSGLTFDTGFTDFLTGLGHTVTRDEGLYEDNNGGPGPHLATLEAADLLIFSLMTSSGRYDGGSGDPDIPIWNAITTPMIKMSPWLARDNRQKWINTTSVNQASIPVAAVMEATVPGHPLFVGVLDPSNQWNHLETHDGDINGSWTDFGSAQILATIVGASAGASTYIAYWDGTAEFYTGSGLTPAGPRLLFNGGAANNSGTNPGEGTFNLSANGQKVLENAVNFLAPTSSVEDWRDS